MEKNKKICVVIPIYKIEINKNDRMSINSYYKYFDKYDLYFIASENLDCKQYINEFRNIIIKKFPNKYFKSAKTYNRLMLNYKFYSSFSEYEYILIAQTDAIIVNPQINFEDFLTMDYDYYGAPWYKSVFENTTPIKKIVKKIIIRKPEIIKAGNGGFSLRKIEPIVGLLKRNKWYIKLFWHFNEDIFFAYKGYLDSIPLKIAPVEVSEKFAIEEKMKEKLSENKIPFAIHGWQHYFDSLEKVFLLIESKN